MIEAIKLLGEHETSKNSMDEIEQFIEENKLKNTKKAICIVFKKEKAGKITYDHTHVEDYDPSKSGKYLYRSHQSRKFDVTPTTKIAFDIEKKQPQVDKALERFQYWFTKFIPLVTDQTDKNLLEQIKNSVFQTKDIIHEDVKKKIGELKDDEKKNSILTIKIQEEGQEKYIGDFDVFKDILKREGLKLLYNRHDVEIKGYGVCHLCGNKKEVCDYFPLKVYSVDKIGFAPEFDRKNAWKRLPVCFSCVSYLMSGDKFLNRHLLKSFYHGYKFYVIPHFIKIEKDAIEEILDEIKMQTKREGYEGLLIEDDYYLEPMKERGDVLNLIFVFCEFGQSIKIVRYVEDVPPSWIKKLARTLKDIENLSIFKEDALKKIGLIGKMKSGDLKDIDIRGTRIGGLVEAFFPNSKETGVYKKYFIDIIGDILGTRPINKKILINAFMREIRHKHVNGDVWNEKMLVLKSLMLLLFLERLNLIKEAKQMYKNENMLEENEKNSTEEDLVKRIEKFFEERKETFTDTHEKAIFLVGVLVNYLLYVQRQERGANIGDEPFRTKLFGLHLDETRVKKIFIEATNKLAEYRRSYPTLENIVAKYLSVAGKEWNMSKDEVSYYFVLGLTLGGIFAVKNENNEKGGKENE